MKVSELPYRRVTIEEVTAVMEDVIARIKNAGSADEILAAREDEQKLMLEYQTNTALAYMRYSINTVDEFYVAENEYYDEIGPAVQNFSVQYASALLDSPFRAKLEEKLSPVLFRAMEVERKSMSPEIVGGYGRGEQAGSGILRPHERDGVYLPRRDHAPRAADEVCQK